MAGGEPKHDSALDFFERVPGIFERAKEGIGAVLQSGERTRSHGHKETHGLRSDIDETTPLSDVKAPNLFERAKEEIEAIVQTIHFKEDDDSRDQLEKTEPKLEKNGNDVKAPNLIERAKEEIEAIVHTLHEKSAHHHHTGAHGRSNGIDESTPIDEVKGPNIFERAKEEIEALAQAIHPNKESKEETSKFVSSPESEGGFVDTIGRGLENVCSPGKDGFKASVGRGLEKVCSPWGSKRE